MEPLMILVLGAIVGTIVLAIFLPIIDYIIRAFT
jgi:type II secretory pathway component PulF